MSEESILKLISTSKEQSWSQKTLISKMREAGVENFVISWDDEAYEAIYIGPFGLIHEKEAPHDYIPTKIENFCMEQISMAIKYHQQDKTTFSEFMRDLAFGGISNCSISLTDNKVLYYTSSRNRSYGHPID